MVDRGVQPQTFLNGRPGVEDSDGLDGAHPDVPKWKVWAD